MSVPLSERLRGWSVVRANLTVVVNAGRADYGHLLKDMSVGMDDAFSTCRRTGLLHPRVTDAWVAIQFAVEYGPKLWKDVALGAIVNGKLKPLIEELARYSCARAELGEEVDIRVDARVVEVLTLDATMVSAIERHLRELIGTHHHPYLEEQQADHLARRLAAEFSIAPDPVQV